MIGSLVRHASASIFDQCTEKVHILAPLIFVPILFCDLKVTEIGGTYLFWGRFVAAYILFNATHTMLTFVVLFKLPEFKYWRRSQLNEHPTTGYPFFVGAIVLFGFSYFLIPIQHTQYINQTIILYLIIENLHGVGQQHGLASLYNHKLRDQIKHESQNRLLIASAHREKVLFLILKVILVVAAASFLTEWRPPLARSFYFCTILVVVFGILINAFCSPKYLISNKKYYLLRLLYWPFVAFSPWALLIQKSLHGLEYIFLYRTITSNSTLQTNRADSLRVTAIALAIAALIHIPTFGMQKIELPHASGFWAIMLFLKFTLVHAHYYLDSKIFKFSDPASRQHVLPLLMRKE